jgi:hypothetical protein
MVSKNVQNWYLLGLTAIALGLLISIFPCGEKHPEDPDKTSEKTRPNIERNYTEASAVSQ